MNKEVSPVRFLDVLPTCQGKVMEHTQAEDEAKVGVKHRRQRILEPIWEQGKSGVEGGIEQDDMGMASG